MGKNNELDILAKLFNNLSEEEKEELFDMVKDKTPKSKEERPNRFLDMTDLPEEKRYREASKKLNKTASKVEKVKRPKIKLVKVSCKNCGKEFEIPSNHPDVNRFICCIK